MTGKDNFLFRLRRTKKNKKQKKNCAKAHKGIGDGGYWKNDVFFPDT